MVFKDKQVSEYRYRVPVLAPFLLRYESWE
jgi:hypothetical protein